MEGRKVLPESVTTFILLLLLHALLSSFQSPFVLMPHLLCLPLPASLLPLSSGLEAFWSMVLQRLPQAGPPTAYAYKEDQTSAA